MKYKVAIILTVFIEFSLWELIVLDCENIDFKNKEIDKINQSSQYLVSTGVYIKSLKTSSYFRHISIPDSVIEILEEYKKYGMLVKKSFVANYVKNLIGYLYKIMANLYISRYS